MDHAMDFMEATILELREEIARLREELATAQREAREAREALELARDCMIMLSNDMAEGLRHRNYVDVQIGPETLDALREYVDGISRAREEQEVPRG